MRGRTDTGLTETVGFWFSAFWKMEFLEDTSAKLMSGRRIRAVSLGFQTAETGKKESCHLRAGTSGE